MAQTGRTRRARTSFAAALLAVLVAAPACVDIVATDSLRYVEREEKRFTVSGRPDVSLSTFDGSIEVRPWDRAEVLVEIEKHAFSKEAAADIEVRTEQDGNRVVVDVRVKRTGHYFGFGNGRSAKLVVSVPASSDLEAASGDGSIDVARLEGRIELRSGDGSIRGRDLIGDVKAQTGDGSIRLENVAGAVDIGTGDGSMIATGRIAGLRARSGDGSVTIRVDPGSVAKQDWTISTGDGSVTLDLPEDFDAELDAHTGDGRVSVREGAMSQILESTRRSVRGRLGDGGRSLHVRSGDGTITLRRS